MGTSSSGSHFLTMPRVMNPRPMNANVRQIAAQKQEIARIEATGTQNSRQIEELKRQVDEYKR